MTKNNSNEPRPDRDDTAAIPPAEDAIPTVPLHPETPPAPTEGGPAARTAAQSSAPTPFLARTWVRATGAAVAAVLLVGVGAGIGAAAAQGDDRGGSRVSPEQDGVTGQDGRGHESDGGPRGGHDRGGRGGDHRHDGGPHPDGGPRGQDGADGTAPEPAPERTPGDSRQPISPGDTEEAP